MTLKCLHSYYRSLELLIEKKEDNFNLEGAKRLSALGGSGGMPTQNFFEIKDQNLCNLMHSRANMEGIRHNGNPSEMAV